MRTHGGFHMAIENTGLNLRPIKEESLRMLVCDHHYVAMETPARKRAPRKSAALLSIFLISVAQRLQMKSDVSKQILMDCFINEKAIWTMSVRYHRYLLAHRNNVCKRKLKAQQKPGQKTTQNPRRKCCSIAWSETVNLLITLCLWELLAWLGISSHAKLSAAHKSRGPL